MTLVHDPGKYDSYRMRNSNEGTEKTPFKIDPAEDGDQCARCLASIALAALSQGDVSRSMIEVVDNLEEQKDAASNSEMTAVPRPVKEVVRRSANRIVTRSMAATAHDSRKGPVTRSKGSAPRSQKDVANNSKKRVITRFEGVVTRSKNGIVRKSRKAKLNELERAVVTGPRRRRVANDPQP
jgi:hypothetical protein